MNNSAHDSVWSTKPPWCQPWTILLTGTMAIAVSWLWLQRWWLTLPVALGIGLWWWYFLLVYPSFVQKAIARESEEKLS